MRHRVTGIERITAQSLVKGSSLTPLVFDCTRSLIRHMPTTTGPSALRAIDVFKDLLAASLSEMLQHARSDLSAYRGAALLRVKAFVERQLCEPSLDPASVARGVGLSTRSIKKLFESEASSLGR